MAHGTCVGAIPRFLEVFGGAPDLQPFLISTVLNPKESAFLPLLRLRPPLDIDGEEGKDEKDGSGVVQIKVSPF